MGAEIPQRKYDEIKTPRTSYLPLIGMAIVLFLVAFLLRMGSSHEEGTPALSPQEEAKLQKRLKEIDDSEQYALVATEDGWYPCLHSGRKSFYLRAGEVWKYGITSKGKLGRYTPSFMLKNKVSYIAQFNGNFAECLKQEQIKLYNYPYLPENLSRPASERLPRPPYNPVMR